MDRKEFDMLPLWDGSVSGVLWENMGEQNLRIGGDGSVYCLDSDGNPRVWCGAARLVGHVCRLNRIGCSAGRPG